MTNEKMLQFVKRWRDIEAQQKDLDFNRSKLARDIRGEFDKGDRGDDQFVNWCVAELGTTVWGAKELLTRAVAATVVPDERTWKMIGGYRAIRPLQDLPKRHQVDVLEAAKVSGRAPINIMRERGLIMAPEPVPAQPVKRDPIVVMRRDNKPTDEQSAHLDAVVLAQFIARTSRSIPRDILAIINRYKSFMRKAA